MSALSQFRTAASWAEERGHTDFRLASHPVTGYRLLSETCDGLPPVDLDTLEQDGLAGMVHVFGRRWYPDRRIPWGRVQAQVRHPHHLLDWVNVSAEDLGSAGPQG